MFAAPLAAATALSVVPGAIVPARGVLTAGDVGVTRADASNAVGVVGRLRTAEGDDRPTGRAVCTDTRVPGTGVGVGAAGDGAALAVIAAFERPPAPIFCTPSDSSAPRMMAASHRSRNNRCHSDNGGPDAGRPAAAGDADVAAASATTGAVGGRGAAAGPGRTCVPVPDWWRDGARRRRHWRFDRRCCHIHRWVPPHRTGRRGTPHGRSGDWLHQRSSRARDWRGDLRNFFHRSDREQQRRCQHCPRLEQFHEAARDRGRHRLLQVLLDPEDHRPVRHAVFIALVPQHAVELFQRAGAARKNPFEPWLCTGRHEPSSSSQEDSCRTLREPAFPRRAALARSRSPDPCGWQLRYPFRFQESRARDRMDSPFFEARTTSTAGCTRGPVFASAISASVPGRPPSASASIRATARGPSLVHEPLPAPERLPETPGALSACHAAPGARVWTICSSVSRSHLVSPFKTSCITRP